MSIEYGDMVLTTEHSGSYGTPVLVVKGRGYGPEEILPDGRSAGQALLDALQEERRLDRVVPARRWAGVPVEPWKADLYDLLQGPYSGRGGTTVLARDLELSAYAVQAWWQGVRTPKAESRQELARLARRARKG